MNAPIAKAEVLSCFVGRLEKAIEGLNRRAKRLRAAPYELVVSAPRIRTTYRGVKPGTPNALYANGEWRIEIHDEVVDVELSGVAVKSSGWIFVAKLDFLSDDASGVVISKAPGFESLSIERPDATRCDHCRVSRRRAVCYVVQNEEGARKVVGSSCLVDFTGMGRGVERLVELAFAAMNVLSEAEGWGEDGGGSRSRAIDLVRYLAPVAGMIRCYGWLSRGKARERQLDAATADMAAGWLATEEPSKRAKHWPELGGFTSRNDRAVALRAIHWCEQLTASSDYEENIRAIAISDYVLPKHMGLAASIVAAWQRHREQLVQRSARPKSNPDATCGTVGKREVFAVLAAGARVYESDFGAKIRVSMIDTVTGAEIVWWCSGTCPDEIWEAATKPRAVGEVLPVFNVAATVKKHDTYQGRRQTVVARLAISVPKPPKKPRGKKAKPVDDEHPAEAK